MSLPVATYVTISASFPDVSLAAKVVVAQGRKGRGKDASRLADFVLKMAECSMMDDYAIFKKEHRPVRFTNFKGKVVFPHPVCQEEAIFLQSNDYSIITGFANDLDALSTPCRKIIEETASDLLERRKAVRQ